MLSLHPQLRSIDGLPPLASLRALDLSSNRLTSIGRKRVDLDCVGF